ncbi:MULTISPECIES: hypothetical protein [unclassified Bradyrhizobium]|uniref:hypothetical protein n=1 Tax=unclassified Bradyrhizobium TaxID=2631580 RepID=UPI00102EC8DB|nr:MULTISPECIES: hypothetical protein [unclassified Bradyrhizobium]MDI4238150.1 hypothetical protein [Bradyrhizobium sp. Arg237L]
MLNTAAFSLVLFSWLKEIGEILLLVGLSGEVALLVLGISKGAWERGLAITFAALVLVGVALEYWADSPRRFGPASQQRIAGALKEFRGTPFDFSVELDPEAVALMEDVGKALDAAGWKRQAVAQGSGYIPPGKPAAGIVVFKGVEVQIAESRHSDWGAAGKPAAVLLHAMRNEGLTAIVKQVPDNQESTDAIHIKIGAKP